MKEQIKSQLNILINYNKYSFLNYFKFSGRSSRTELIYATITHCFITLFANFISESIFNNDDFKDYILLPYFLVTFIPSISLLYRRLHDSSRKGWISLIPIIIFIVFSVLANIYGDTSIIVTVGILLLTLSLGFSLLFLIKPGDLIENKYGLPTKYPFE